MLTDMYDMPADQKMKIDAYTEHLYVNPRVDRYGLAAGTDFHWTRIHAVGGRTNEKDASMPPRHRGGTSANPFDACRNCAARG